MPVGFEVDDVWRSRNRGFQMAAIQPSGIVVHLTGQVAWSGREEVLGSGDVETQTRQIFDNISKLLKKVGGQLSDIAAITTFFTDRSELQLIQKVRTEYLDDGHEPVSTSVMVTGLGHKDFLVELTPLAVIPEHRFIKPE